MTDTPTLTPAPAASGDTLTLATFAERAYLDYAMSVVKGRALPHASDGQKPVQRRILYAMHQLRLDATAKPRKSAAVVGDVLGKLHPHGDQSVYDALVRMAQNFQLRYPLIDGHGNFGSRDGDGAAAMRYTEARLTPISRLLLDELDMGTVDFIPNYDGSSEEPAQLPARLPFVLLNGASGIAVGLATEILPHNLREVARATIAMIRKPRLTLEELLEFMPGPDFPGGGQVISSPETIAEVYRTGRGSLKVRARWTIEELARGQWQLVVTELPPGASSQKILEEIEELTNPKIKVGKKALTPDQQSQKAALLAILDSVRDESSRVAAVRLVFEPKSRNLDPQEFANQLLAQTSLESSASANLVMVGQDGRPRQKSVLDILGEWIGFRLATMQRRTAFRLQKVDDRLHILEGRQIVLLNIDAVIQIIRESDEPKPALMEAFALSERQAEDILEIRLRQLARLEAIKIGQEISALRDERQTLQNLLDDPAAMRKLLIREIEADQKQFGDARRTLIEVAERAVVEVRITDEPVTVIVSRKGWVRARPGYGLDPQQFSFKAGDSLYRAFECRTIDSLLVFSDAGRVHSVAISGLPGGRGDGVPVTTLIELAPGQTIAHYFAGSPETRLILASDQGAGLMAKVADMISRTRTGRAFFTMEDKARLLPPEIALPTDNALACLSTSGRLLVFGLDEVKTLTNGGRGVALIDLEADDRMASILPISQAGMLIQGAGRGGKIQQLNYGAAALAPHLAKRARKGRALETRLKEIQLLRRPPKA